MNFNIVLVQGLVIAGVLQGFLFSIGLFVTKKKMHRCVLFLVLLVAAISYSNFQYIITWISLMSSENMYIYIFLPVAPLIPSLIYAFVATFLDTKKKLNKLEWLLFLPFLLFLVFAIVYKIVRFANYQNQAFDTFSITMLNAQELTAIVLMLIVLPLTIIKSFNAAKKEAHLKKNEKQSLLWLQTTLILFFTGSLFWIYFVIKNIFFRNFDIHLAYTLWIFMSFLIYWLAYRGLYKFELWNERKRLKEIVKTQSPSNLNDEIRNGHLKKIKDLLDNEKIYLDSQLTLEGLAERVGLSASHLSRLLNNELNTSFTNLLNLYRTNEAINLLSNTSFNHYTITAIGLESGFNSKTSFYRTFKQVTGMSPAAYKEKL